MEAFAGGPNEGRLIGDQRPEARGHPIEVSQYRGLSVALAEANEDELVHFECKANDGE